MSDQAQRLRDMINAMKKQRMYESTKEVEVELEMKEEEHARVITITSGKGGVGKTNFTINLGLALRKLGYRVTILDADLGLANIDVVVGLIPKYTLAHVIRNEKTIEEVIVEGPEGIKIVSGGSGLSELVNLSKEQLSNLIYSLKTLGKSADFLLVDTGAGINHSVMSFVHATNEIVLVTTPEPTSITDAYAMIKNIVSQDKDKKIRLLINRIENNQEGAAIFEKLNTASQRFLNISLEKLGYLYDDAIVSKSVKAQVPFICNYPNSLASQGVFAIASRITNETDEEIYQVGSFKRFMNKLFHGYR